MRTSILLPAAAAATLVLASVSPWAFAQGGPMGGPMMGPKMEAPAPKGAKSKRPLAKGRGYLPRASGGKGPGRCGTNMYWKAGKCVDARTSK
jgi:hypothetical protein